MISISLFFCCKKVFTLMYIWIIGKYSMKHRYLKQSPKYRRYYDLHVQSDTLLLADVFKNFQNMCLEIRELDPVLPHQDQYGNHPSGRPK